MPTAEAAVGALVLAVAVALIAYSCSAADVLRVSLLASSGGTVVIPVVYDPREWGFVATVRLGGLPVKVVIDTGSADMVVASSECVAAKRCDFDYNHRSYSEMLSVTARVSTKARLLQYGSLRVDGVDSSDSLQLCDGCATIPNAPFVLAHDMQGTDSNILGLSPHSRVLRAAGATAFGFDFSRSRVWIGALPQDQRADARFPLGSEVAPELISFYVANAVVDDRDAGPAHVVLDTGTVYSYTNAPELCARRALQLGDATLARNLHTVQHDPQIIAKIFGPSAAATHRIVLVGLRALEDSMVHVDIAKRTLYIQ